MRPHKPTDYETPAAAKKRYAESVKDYKEMSALLGADYDTFHYM